MDIISNYTSYFHDGSIIDIKHEGSSIIFSMASAEMFPDDNPDQIPLSLDSTIRCRLHLEGVSSILDVDKEVTTPLKMIAEGASILDLEIHPQRLVLNIRWEDYSSHIDRDEYSFWVIRAAKIWFENVPDLFDPFLDPFRAEMLETYKRNMYKSWLRLIQPIESVDFQRRKWFRLEGKETRDLCDTINDFYDSYEILEWGTKNPSWPADKIQLHVDLLSEIKPLHDRIEKFFDCDTSANDVEEEERFLNNKDWLQIVYTAQQICNYIRKKREEMGEPIDQGLLE